MIQQFKSRQFVAFLCTGGAAALLNFGTRIVYSHWVSFSVAIVMAYITGMIAAFFLAKVFVFRESQQALHHAAVYFSLVNLVAAAQTWIISMSLASYALPLFGVQNNILEISHAVGVMFPVFTSFLGHKHYSFR